MSVWEWVTTSTSIDSLLTTLGAGVLAILFARDLILTRAQHARRVHDLTEHHRREREEKDSRIAEIRESRDGWKEATRIERDRADKVTASFGEMSAAVTGMLHVLESLDRALPAPRGGDNESA